MSMRTIRGLVRQARRFQKRLDLMLRRLGAGDARGVVTRAIENLRGDMRLIQNDYPRGGPSALPLAHKAFSLRWAELRMGVLAATRELVIPIIDYGRTVAERNQVDVSAVIPQVPSDLAQRVDEVLKSAESFWGNLRTMIETHVLHGNWEAILGDGRRTRGLLNEAALLRFVVDNIVGAVMFALTGIWLPFADGTWYKMAIATLDSRTTETCRNVHGQVRLIETPFELHGEPKYAQFMMWPPFHWYCRTVPIIVRSALMPDPEEVEQMLQTL